MAWRRDDGILMGTWPHVGRVSRNWGDKANPWLMHRLAGRPVANVRETVGWDDRPVHRVIGSSLAEMEPRDHVWGTGFMRATAKPRHRARHIHAVRGPNTRRLLAERGIEAPEVYGDAVVLFPLVYRPEVEVVHDVGVVQHFREVGEVAVPRLDGAESVTVVDISGGVEEVVDHVLACRRIVSSSLHGVILAHAYGIPAVWLKASDLPLGDDFKFHDYYASIGHPHVVPATLDASGVVQPGDVPSLPVPGHLDGVALLEACPFLDRRTRARWVAHLRAERAAGRRGTVLAL